MSNFKGFQAKIVNSFAEIDEYARIYENLQTSIWIGLVKALIKAFLDI